MYELSIHSFPMQVGGLERWVSLQKTLLLRAAARAALPPAQRRANDDLGEAKPPQTPPCGGYIVSIYLPSKSTSNLGLLYDVKQRHLKVVYAWRAGSKLHQNPQAICSGLQDYFRQSSRISYLPRLKAISLGITHGCAHTCSVITHVKIGQIYGFLWNQGSYSRFGEAKSYFKRKRRIPFEQNCERPISLTDAGWYSNIGRLECANLSNLHLDRGSFGWR